MAKWTTSEQHEWAENLTGYEKGKGGHMTQKATRALLLNTASAEEQDRGFDREDIRSITAAINQLLQANP